MAMRFVRLVTLSLHMHLRHEIVTYFENVPLSSVDNQTYYDSRLLMWSYNRPVNVYKDDILVDPSEYDVFYNPSVIGGEEVPARIKFKSSQGEGRVTADLWFNHLPIKPSYTGSADVPLLTITSGTSINYSWELGGSDIASINFMLDIYADGVGQRDDLADEIVEALHKTAPLIDFNIAFPIDSQGRRNPNYDAEGQTIAKIMFTNIVSTPNPSGIDETEEINRALVTCNASALRSWN